MAKGRMLNRETSLSIKLNALVNDTTRLLATWTIPHLDKNGVFHADAQVVRSLVFPLRQDLSTQEVAAMLDDMERVGLIRRFQAAGRVWQVWPGFEHNQPYLRRDKEKTDFPTPPDFGGNDVSTDSDTIPTLSDKIPTVSRQIPTADGEKQAQLEVEEESEVEEEGKGNARVRAPDPALPPYRRHVRGFGGVVLTADEDPRVAAYLATLRPEITETNANLVRNQIPFEDLGVWQETLTTWAANEWRADNFSGLFERFEAARRGKRIRATMPAKPAPAGRGRPVMLPQVPDPTPTQRAAIDRKDRQTPARVYSSAPGPDVPF